MRRFIIEDNLESFLGIMDYSIQMYDVEINTIRLSKDDGVNYNRLKSVIDLINEIHPNNRKVVSNYIFLENQLKEVSLSVGKNDLNTLNEIKRDITNTVMRLRSNNSFYTRFTSPHRLLLGFDPLFNQEHHPISTDFIYYSGIEHKIEFLKKWFAGTGLYEKFIKFKDEYYQEYLASSNKLAKLSENVLDRKSVHLQHEQIIGNFFSNSTKNDIYKEKFSPEAKTWIVERLEINRNIKV